MPKDRFSLLLYRTCLLGCLLGFAATLYFLVGVSGHIGNSFVNIAIASVVLLAGLFFLYVFFVLLPDKSRLGFLIWLLILSALLAEVILGLVPPTARDELIHHLAMPKLYLQAGRIEEIPFALHSYYPMLLDMLYTPFVKWGWDSAPKLIHGLFGFLTGLLLYSYLARRLSPVYGLLGFFFFVSTPIVLRLSNLAYVDLGLVFYSTASLLCILQWIEAGKIHNPQSAIRNPHSRWLVLAGLSAGFALATKPNGLLVFLLLFLVLAFVLGRGKERGIGETASWLILFLVLAFVPFSPWFFKNLSQTGNPVFPFFAGFFGGEGGVPSLGVFTKRQLFYGESWWQIAALPLRIFFSGQDDNPQYFDGVLNPILIIFLPWVFKGKWLREKKLLFAFAGFFFLYALFLVDLRIRYILPIVPALVILLVYSIHNIYLRIVQPSLLFGAVILLLALNGIYLWNYSHKVSPIRYLLAKENREAYLTRMLPDYPAIQYINRNLPSQAKVYLLFTGNRGYYCERAYFYDTWERGRTLLRILDAAGGDRGIREGLENLGVTHLLVRQDLFVRFLNDNFSLDQKEKWVRFGDRHWNLLFEKNGFSVYEFRMEEGSRFLS